MNDCDTLFLIFDTARHGHYQPDHVELEEHVDECYKCHDLVVQIVGFDGQDLTVLPLAYAEDIAQIRVWTESADLVEFWECDG